MKLTTATGDVDTAGLEDSTAFSIKMNTKAFRILLDGLYSDKVGAVVRELSTNAYDAHLAIGKGDVPFEVSLPTAFDPVFKIRDYGVSMTHEQTMRLMSTVFESSKDDSNNQVGAFGLGSKSPFAITDTFALTVWKDGEKRIYSAFIAKNGVPALALLAKEASNAANGVEFELTVNPKDVPTFKEKAETILRWFPTTPKIVTGNASVEKPESLASGNGWSLLKNNGDRYYDTTHIKGALARQGCVVYPLNADSIPGITQAHKAVLTSPIVIDFPIGTLEVAASREGLSYDKRTCDNILARLNTVVDEVCDHYGKAISSAPTKWAAAKIRNELRNDSNLPQHLIEMVKRNAKWNGQPLSAIDGSFALRGVEDKLSHPSSLGYRPVCYAIDNYVVSSFGRYNVRNSSLFTNDNLVNGRYFNWVYGDDRLTVYFTLETDRPTYESGRISKAHDASKTHKYLVFVVKAEKDADVILNMLGNPTNHGWTKDLPAPPPPPPPPPRKMPPKKGTTKKVEVRVKKLTATKNPTSGAHVVEIGKEEVVVLQGDAYYAITCDNKVKGLVAGSYYGRTTILEFIRKYETILDSEMVSLNHPVYLISTVYESRVEDFGGWKPLIPFIKETIEKSLEPKIREEAKTLQLASDLSESSWASLLRRDARLAKTLSEIKNGPLFKMTEVLAKHKIDIHANTLTVTRKYQNLAEQIGSFGINGRQLNTAAQQSAKSDPVRQEIVKTFEECAKAYPLIADFDSYVIRTSRADKLTAFIEYIEAMERLRTHRATAKATKPAAASAAKAAPTVPPSSTSP